MPARRPSSASGTSRRFSARPGWTLGDIVRINAYVTDRAHLRPYMDVRDRLFSSPAPASTLMIVSGFARPEFKVEVEVIAAGDDSRRCQR